MNVLEDICDQVYSWAIKYFLLAVCGFNVLVLQLLKSISVWEDDCVITVFLDKISQLFLALVSVQYHNRLSQPLPLNT